jgi:hypothetical protein
MESPFPIVGEEFFFAGMYLPSCSLATDIHVTIHFVGKIQGFQMLKHMVHIITTVLEIVIINENKFMMRL